MKKKTEFFGTTKSNKNKLDAFPLNTNTCITHNSQLKQIFIEREKKKKPNNTQMKNERIKR